MRKAEVFQVEEAEVTADTIAKLAYELWLKRGCPDGSPEQDWYEAERMIKGSAESTGASPTESLSTELTSEKSTAMATTA